MLPLLRTANKQRRRVATAAATTIRIMPGTAAVVVDNPCWGSPEQCSLVDLLLRPKGDSNETTNSLREAARRLVIHESPDFVALNKPPDLRMDGPFPATVHKLLMFLYPTAALRQQAVQKQKKNSAVKAKSPTTTSSSSSPELLQRPDDDDDRLLLEYIQDNLHQHNDLADHKTAVRPCHQLDYATSGVLWVARTLAANQLASRALADRSVQKTYTAVVHGHLTVQSSETWPVIPQRQVQNWWQQVELSYRRKRRKRRPETFPGFLPPSAIFVTWKSQHNEQRHDDESVQDGGSSELRRARRRNRSKLQLDPTEWAQVWKPVNKELNAVTREQVMNLDWKDIKGMPIVKRVFEKGSDICNQILREKVKEGQSQFADGANVAESIPIVFRVEEEQQDSTFFISAPLADAPDDFSMRLPPGVQDMAASSLDANLIVGDDRLDYKPSLTRCIVEQRATWKGRRVTKVRLEPRTGRRHQLRVHMALVGHPIVGDETYARAEKRATAVQCCEKVLTRENPALSARMCLHAHKLSVELHDHRRLDLLAPDPFYIDPESKNVKLQ